VAENTDKRKSPTPLEIYDSEGGTARYPEGFKIRGHDANELLDMVRGTSSKADSQEPSKPDSE
jgi:hypothetical protein